uniref:2Fe-2S ferredoxin-type domain-containing protein n=1 Tax=Corethron hystrix TaxID=216773 RepID=A0A7S1B4V7_9STRA|mmetsp:Transcript_11352/g.24929  ORF Transcript_11352/g.24929 Transcript_11352/m.24929 type:complete len:229 (+) Transcript_11352:69-755(+)
MLNLRIYFFVAIGSVLSVHGFQLTSFGVRQSTCLSVIESEKKNKGYERKWKKKQTLADQLQIDGKLPSDPEANGLVGDIPVIFKTGNNTIQTLAIAGQPLSEVASQAGVFIKYGCGKGDCGTCESMCNGKWIRPCVSLVPSDLQNGDEYVVQIKKTKNKAKSSGRFYSVRSILFGFYNNVLGMWGFVRTRKEAKKNWQERQDYEKRLEEIVAEKRAARARAALAEKKP